MFARAASSGFDLIAWMICPRSFGAAGFGGLGCRFEMLYREAELALCEILVAASRTSVPGFA
eukprot:1295864-Rhodomonas_salina.4